MAVLCWSLPTVTQTSHECACISSSCPCPSTPSNPSGPSQNHGWAGFPVFHSSFPIAVYFTLGRVYRGFPGGSGGKEPVCLCRRHIRLKFDPWVGKSPWRRAWQPTPVFWPGKFHGLYSPWGHKESDMTERL